MPLRVEDIVLIVLYAHVAVLFAAGMAPAREPDPDADWEPPVTVIVRPGTGGGTGRCLDSLKNMDYPAAKLQCLVVGSGHADSLPPDRRGARGEAAPPGATRFVPEADRGPWAGLECAAAGEVLFFTEGDTGLPRSWIRSLLASFDGDTGAVAAPVLPPPGTGSAVLLDRVHAQALGSAWAALSFPPRDLGGHFCIRRSAFAQAGGFGPGPYGIRFEAMLARRLRGGTSWRVKVPLFAECAAFAARPSGSGLLSALLSGVFRRDPSSWLPAAARLTVPAGLAAGSWETAVAAFVILCAADALLLLRPLDGLARLPHLRALLPWEAASVAAAAAAPAVRLARPLLGRRTGRRDP